MAFIPLMQRPASDKNVPIEKDDGLYAGAIVVETERPQRIWNHRLAKTLASINPNLAVVKFQTFDAQIADRFNDDRLLSRLTMLFGIGATVSGGRTVWRDGVWRSAAHARDWDSHGAGSRATARGEHGNPRTFLQTAVGLAIGLPAAMLCVHFVKSQLYEVTSASATVLAGAILTLGVAAGVAGVIPARRAASIEPMQALRTD